MGTRASWTPERRAKQAEAIQRWRPWEHSTGPRTDEGKAIASRNADKGLGAVEAHFMEIRLKVRMGFLQKAEEGLQKLREMASQRDDL